MRYFVLFCGVVAVCASGGISGRAEAAGVSAPGMLAPHKALYDIDLVATRSGSQITNISGKMFYSWKPSCDAWVTDHRFTLYYEYSDNPGMRIQSDFSTFETFDGRNFDFSSRRRRDGEMYQELRGNAQVPQAGGGEAVYRMPSGLKYDLVPGTMFPMAHTEEMVRQAREGRPFFSAAVFDGSDEEGPVEINTFIGESVNAMTVVKANDALDMSLINTPAWNVRMAVFPLNQSEAEADYEMSMIFHDNGVISDMLIEYDDFSVKQTLVALERLEGEDCSGK